MTDIRDHLQQTLGSGYRLERELGGGGMSRVFVAEEASLGRKVVVKVLLPELAAGVSVERFRREIQLVAQLQHACIVPLLTAGVSDGLPFYTMPLVEGESLRARLDREHELPVNDVVRMMRDIAGALSYAHDRGVVHRDVKPDNVLLTKHHALITDFGVAKALSESTNPGSHGLTSMGVALGTPAYMAPEQATADPHVDQRADIYALGAVAYEMLAGQPLFAARSPQAMLAAHTVENPVPVATRRPSIPPALAALVMQCLEKRAADRPQTAELLVHALDALATPSGGTQPTMQSVPAPRGRFHATGRALWLAAGALTLVVGYGWWRERSGRPGIPTAVAFSQGERLQNVATLANPVVGFAPDGRSVAYTAAGSDGRMQLYLRTLTEAKSRVVASSEDANTPFFSPDGAWLGFYRGGRLWKVPATGGSPIAIATLGQIAGASWGANDTIVVGTDEGRLARVPASGGAPEPFSRPDRALGQRHKWPLVFGDGRVVLYTNCNCDSDSGLVYSIAASATDGAKETILQVAGTSPVAVTSGVLIFASATGDLMAIAFDGSTLSVTGAPVLAQDHVTVRTNGLAGAWLSSDGSLLYRTNVEPRFKMITSDLGSARTLLETSGVVSYPRYSPNGDRIAYNVESAKGLGIWIYDFSSGRPWPLTDGKSHDLRPEWTPDGKAVLFVSDRGGELSPWLQPTDRSSPASELLKVSGAQVMEATISPDGNTLIYRRTGSGAIKHSTWYRKMRGDTTPRPIGGGKVAEVAVRPSPDGKWIAYQSRESGKLEVYVSPFPGPGPRSLVSVDGGATPVWSADGRRLFFTHGRSLVSATLSLNPAFRVDSLKTIIEDSDAFSIAETNNSHANFDVSPDGKQYLLVEPAGPDRTLVVVPRWMSGVRSKLRRGRRANRPSRPFVPRFSGSIAGIR